MTRHRKRLNDYLPALTIVLLSLGCALWAWYTMVERTAVQNQQGFERHASRASAILLQRLRQHETILQA